MAILLDKPHTATVKAVTPSRLYLIEDADAFMAKAPDLLFHVGKVMAHRLQLATGYLADIKSQFAEHGSHLSMVDEVLETLLHQQDPGFAPGGSSRDSGGSGC